MDAERFAGDDVTEYIDVDDFRPSDRRALVRGEVAARRLHVRRPAVKVAR